MQDRICYAYTSERRAYKTDSCARTKASGSSGNLSGAQRQSVSDCRAEGSMHGSIVWPPLLRYGSISATHLHALYTCCCANSNRLSRSFFFVVVAIRCTRALLANNQLGAIIPRLSFSQRCSPEIS